MPREGGASSTPRLLDSITAVSGILDRSASWAIDDEYSFAYLAALIARGLLINFPPSLMRGRREDRVHAAPAVSCAICAQKNAHEHTGTGGASRPSLRSGFTAYFVLFPVNGFLATVAPEKPASQELDASTAASEPHDFAVRVMPASSVMASASTASHRAFVTIASRPSCRVGRRMDELICTRTKGEYFCAGYWTKRWSSTSCCPGLLRPTGFGIVARRRAPCFTPLALLCAAWLSCLGSGFLRGSSSPTGFRSNQAERLSRLGPLLKH